MKCINKMRLLCLCGIAAVFMSGCGQTVVSYDNPYDIYSTSADYGLASEGAGSEKTYFSQNLCVADDVNIGLIAHDSKKKLMQNFCIAYRGILSKNELYATGTTGRLIEEVTNLNVHKYLAGHLGGSQQLGAQIEHNEIDLVIFLRDPLTPKSHEPDVNNVVKLCDTHNIPLATNLATAELLIRALDRGDLEWREMYK